MFRTVLFAVGVSLVLVAASGVARADRRSFLETYEYMTMPEGDVELEFWNRQQRDSFAADAARAFSLELELEYGITSHWDIALYQMFDQGMNPADPTLDSSFGYQGTKIETRYRLGERGTYPVDTVLYLELVKEFPTDTWELEPKLILARDFGKVTASLNAALGVEVVHQLDMAGDPEVEAELEPNWAFGLTYEISPVIKVGAETFGKAHLEESEVEAFAGPSVSWAPSSKIWIATTAALGLTDDSPRYQLGFIAGVGL